MTDVKPQAYMYIVDGVFGSVHRHRIDAQPFASEHGLCVEEVPLYTAEDVGLVEQEPVGEVTHDAGGRWGLLSKDVPIGAKLYHHPALVQFLPVTPSPVRALAVRVEDVTEKLANVGIPAGETA